MVSSFSAVTDLRTFVLLGSKAESWPKESEGLSTTKITVHLSKPTIFHIRFLKDRGLILRVFIFNCLKDISNRKYSLHLTIKGNYYQLNKSFHFKEIEKKNRVSLQYYSFSFCYFVSLFHYSCYVSITVLW